MGIKKSMTGTPWHIEKIHSEGNHNRRTCFNCKNLDGHWCREKRIQVTNNNAPICSKFTNKYGTNSITKKNSHQVYKHFENYSKQKKVLHASINHSNIPRPISTVLQIKTSQEIFEKIQEKVLILGQYSFRGIVENVISISNFDSKYINIIFITNGSESIRCILKKKSLKIIESGNFMTRM